MTADGDGVVSHAGAELLREMAGFTGSIDSWDRALIDTYKGMPIHFPDGVLAELALATVNQEQLRWLDKPTAPVLDRLVPLGQVGA